MNELKQELKQLEQRVILLETQIRALSALIDNFSGRIVYNKEVQFKAKVYDATGGVVTEINP